MRVEVMVEAEVSVGRAAKAEQEVAAGAPAPTLANPTTGAAADALLAVVEVPEAASCCWFFHYAHFERVMS